MLLINTPLGKHAQRDDYTLRQAAIANRVPYTTTLSAASAACDAIEALALAPAGVRPLQEWHAMLATVTGRASRLTITASTSFFSDTMTYTPVPLLDLKAQHATIKHEVAALIDEVVEEQAFILGPIVGRLECAVAGLSQTKYAIGCANGTDAILLAMRALEIGRDDEVVTTPFTFFATAGTIHNVGATPVFADIDPLTFNIDPAAAGAAVTSRTKAVIPVDLFGQMAAIEQLRAPRRNAADHRGRRPVDRRQPDDRRTTRSWRAKASTIGTFSFFPSKNLGGYGDGGMMVTQDEALATSC